MLTKQACKQRPCAFTRSEAYEWIVDARSQDLTNSACVCIDIMGVLDLDDPAYNPFRRSDRYGTLGKAKLPLLETVWLWLLIIFVAPLKFLGCFLCVFACWAVCR